MHLCHSICDNAEYIAQNYGMQIMRKGMWSSRWAGCSPYNQDGVQYCPRCSKYLQKVGDSPEEHMELFCPCCNGRLRRGPRHKPKSVKAALKRI
jgi:hypothetical protein